jgi:hypothetical protein
MHAEIHQQVRNENVQQYKRQDNRQQQQISPRLLPSQYTPPMQSDDDMMFAQSFEREGSRTPPLFAYHTYPAPEDIVYPPYPHTQQYRPVSGGSDWTRSETDYLAPVPVTLPSMMQFHDSIKREHEDTMSPFNMSYQGLPALDMHNQHGYGDSDPHVRSAHAMQRFQSRS